MKETLPLLTHCFANTLSSYLFWSLVNFFCPPSHFWLSKFDIPIIEFTRMNIEPQIVIEKIMFLKKTKLLVKVRRKGTHPTQWGFHAYRKWQVSPWGRFFGAGGIFGSVVEKMSCGCTTLSGRCFVAEGGFFSVQWKKPLEWV